MNSVPSEASPLLRHGKSPSPSTPQASMQPAKTVTFDESARGGTSYGSSAKTNLLRPLQSNPASSSSSSSARKGPPGQPVLAALNSKLRRRHSQEAPSITVGRLPLVPKIGPQRTTKNAQKLKLLPNPETGEEEDEWVDEEVSRDVYSQIRRIKEPTARRDAARLGRADRDRLPRVTAYCTANSYRLESVIKFLKARATTRGTAPKRFDECVYSPYNYHHEEKTNFRLPRHQSTAGIEGGSPLSGVASFRASEPDRRFSDSDLVAEAHKQQQLDNLVDIHTTDGSNRLETLPELHPASPSQLLSRRDDSPFFATTIDTPEVFLFDYGTVVIWGMTVEQESRFLNEVSKFASSVLSTEDTQVENFNFYYTRDYQARIYNDFISLRDPRNYMTKLAISHALSQSVKTSLFEDLVSESIAATSPLPSQIAQTGSVNLTRRQINMQIGELFILRINIHLQGSVLDSPELMWTEPQLDPIYQAVRSYLEMDQRAGLLTERLEVIADLLAVLKDQLSHRHGEYLEWIVIVLIAAEIVIAGINIVVDLYAGFD
ncbi:hypothetical protein FQN57_001634 [Myotisia sp. PD_48]|nr:hypothetical protein FQN57_001634 [Myotisia sp. PD_48]